MNSELVESVRSQRAHCSEAYWTVTWVKLWVALPSRSSTMKPTT